MSKGQKDSAGVPSKADILRFVEDSDDKVTKRELARAFHVKGADRVELKRRLREMMDDGMLDRDPDKALRPAGKLPSVTVVEAAGPDMHGDMLLKPLNWKADTPPPPIWLAPDRRKGKTAALARGDRALVRLSAAADGAGYTATVIKTLEGAPKQMLGVFHGGAKGGRVVPVDKGARGELLIEADQTGSATDGELVRAEMLPRQRHRVHGLRPARVIERLGDVSAPGSISLIAIYEHGLPVDFSAEAIREAEAAKPVSAKGREDLRALPLITIDPSDARDHDDAVFAEPDEDPANPGGWHLIVAIADVAHYVRPGAALDRDARLRGNSAYFPDRVVPMLPEALSNDMCSLNPGADRACLAVHVWIDADGKKRRHRFTRAIMRSAANIAYQAVQAAFDGKAEGAAADLQESILDPLQGAHDALLVARAARRPLDIESDEKKIILNAAGEVADIQPRVQLRAHRLVEDFMILANVCAAETLEARETPCMYRVHEPPPVDKLEALREFLGSLDYTLPRAETFKPENFNRILQHFDGTPHDRLVNQVVLRSQTQACYSPHNKGHFGLALQRYAHFTSPIRRYADLLVHRALVRALGLGADGLTEPEKETMVETGEHISMTERRAMMAERDSTDRYMASYLAGRVGQQFSGAISGVTRFGLFVTLEPMGGDGLVPVSAMNSDYYQYEEHRHALIGRRSGTVYQLGQRVEVRLAEAKPVSGGLKLELVGEPAPTPRGAPGTQPSPAMAKSRRKPKGKPKSRPGKSRGGRR